MSSIGVTRRQAAQLDLVRPADNDEEYNRCISEAAQVCNDRLYQRKPLGPFQNIFVNAMARSPESRALIFAAAVLSLVEFVGEHS